MRLKKVKLLSGILMSIILITVQTPVFSMKNESENAKDSAIHNYVPSVMNTEKITPKNQSNFQTELAEEQWILIDNLDDSTADPISISTKDVDSFEVSSEGKIEVVYTFNDVQTVGLYLEKDIMRKLYTTDLEKDLVYRTADEVADLLGLDQLKSAVENKSEEIIVAVIDTGIDKNHSLFKNRLVQGYDVIDDDLTVVDDDGHGTHVAGIIALSTPENVKIMPIDVFDGEGALDSSIVSGIYYAVENGAKIINLSLGGYGMNSYLQKGIQYARNNGVMIVAASGNEAHDVKYDYPASFKEVITVGATSNTGNLLYYSNFGDAVDICAPGEKIVSAYLNEGTEALSGTSMAAPFVTATAAMLWLDHEIMSLPQIETLLLENTKDLGAIGKDSAFGYGEINYENYKIDENFYLIGYSDKTNALSFKYDMPLNYYAGTKVTKIEFLVDGQSIYSTTKVNGHYNAPIDIRHLNVGSHTLKINLTMKDGSKKLVFDRPFTIPKYNVKIKLYDFYEEDVTQWSANHDLTGSIIFNAQVGTYTKSDEFNYENNTLNKNIDFTKEAAKNMIHYFVLDWFDEDMPVYFRGLFSGGDYLVEPSESRSTSFKANLNYDLANTCTLNLPFASNHNNDLSTVKWGNFQPMRVSFAGLYQEDQTMIDNNQYVIYHDQADFNVTINEEIIESTTKKNSSICIYNNYLSHLQNNPNISTANLGYFSIENEDAIDSNFVLVDLTNGYNLSFSSDTFDYEAIVPTNAYFLYGINRFDFQNGQKQNYIYKTDMNFNTNRTFNLKLGSKLYDVVWSNVLSDQYFYHSWRDEFDSNVFMTVGDPRAKTTEIVPTMILTNTKTKSNIKVIGDKNVLFRQGTSKMISAHKYDISSVPNGIYEVAFHIDSIYEKIPIEASYTVIEIKNGKAVSQENTNPKTIGDQTISIMPHDKLEIDLSQMIWDSEQNTLYYSVNEGAIQDNTYYYQDILGKDKVINIKAFDGMGGSTDFKLTIKIGYNFELSNDFEPVQDVILMGASSWAKTAVSQAITDGFANNDLLENYQSEITREELSELIVNAIEAKRGKITILKGLSFKDTTSEAVLKAASLGIISSNGSGEINPYDEVTRQQLCTMLLKTAQKLNNQAYDVKAKNQNFSDWNQVASWAVQGTTFCLNNGIISGINGKILPQEKTTREEAIVMLVKLWNGVNNKTLK